MRLLNWQERRNVLGMSGMRGTDSVDPSIAGWPVRLHTVVSAVGRFFVSQGGVRRWKVRLSLCCSSRELRLPRPQAAKVPSQRQRASYLDVTVKNLTVSGCMGDPRETSRLLSVLRTRVRVSPHEIDLFHSHLATMLGGTYSCRTVVRD